MPLTDTTDKETNELTYGVERTDRDVSLSVHPSVRSFVRLLIEFDSDWLKHLNASRPEHFVLAETKVLKHFGFSFV